MPDILDIFNSDAFSATTLTGNVNLVPNSYGRINDLGIFANEPVGTTSVAIAIENGVLNILPTRARGAPPSLGAPVRSNMRSFMIPHIPHDDSVLATDVQNMLARAPSLGLESVLGMVNRKLITMRRKHAITLENLRMGALRGIIRDYDGSAILNLFTEYGVTQNSVDFAFGTSTSDMGSKSRSVTGLMEDNLAGDTMTSVHALCSPEFFDKFITMNSVKEAFKFFVTSNNNNPNRDDVRRSFNFQGITYEEYRGSATKLNEDKTTTVQRFIPAGEAIFIPMGTTDTFTNYWGPPDFIDSVNELPDLAAQVFVAPLERQKFGKGMDIHTESNPLPMVKRPALLIRGYSSN